MDVSTISNNSLDIQSLLISETKGVQAGKGSNVPTQTAEYAKKGEPMYMSEMDTDGDGTVTLDEYKDYCKSKGISTREMVKMSKLAASYRTMKAENETIDYISKLIPNVHPNLKQAEPNSAQTNHTNNRYNISNDTNQNKKVSYNEYMDYCNKNAVTQELKANTKFEEDNNGKLIISNSGKSVETYKNSDATYLKSTFEELV